MADAAVSLAIENVGSFLIEKGKFLSGVRGEMEEMQIELKWMHCFLQDAERRKGESHLVRNWVSEIQDAAYEVEDLVERFVLKSALRCSRKGVANRIKKYTFFMRHVVELHQVGSRIDQIKAKLSKLRTRLQTYGIRELRVGREDAAEGGSSSSRRKRQDYPHVVDHNVVGLDEKIRELVELLIHVGEHGPASVVCLYGMGGLGKTTTAKKVYNDRRIRTQFEGFAWVYISQQLNQRQAWESILIQLSGKKVEGIEKKSEDELTSQLCHLQKNKKCLLVFDDIWRSQDWDKLSAAFPYLDTDYRSKILFTTRNKNVASHGVYHTSLNILDDNSSLELLKNTILFLGGPNHPLSANSSMKKSAREMVRECAGLPLAIIVLGGILATKHELKEWDRVGVSIKLLLKRGEQKENDGVTSVLESSYEDLPHNLRSCFLYFSRYREDEEIGTTELMQRWIGEGFVPSSMEEGDETMEEIAEEYLNELVSRCMIQVGKKGHTGRVKTCRMHDLMRDLCVSKAKEEGFVHSINLGVGNEGMNLEKVNVRRLCILASSHKIGDSISTYYLQEISPRLRSIWFHAELDDDRCREIVLIVRKLKSVRVLELPSIIWIYWWESVNGHIGNLIHLRFLKLQVPKLHTSIGDLRCLKTLNLGKCDSNLIIPDSLWGMEQLRHLYLPSRGGFCESTKPRVSNFKNLQTLVNFPPSKFDLEQNLIKFTNVRELVIVRSFRKVCEVLRTQEIVFNRLESLSFKSFSEDVDLEAVTIHTPRLYRLFVEGFIRFPATASCSALWPSNLTKLVLRGSILDESYMGTLPKLRNLKVLFLIKVFTAKEMIFHENDFLQLFHLSLDELNELEAWPVHEGALASLSCLEIKMCHKLKSFPDGFKYLKQLKELTVRYMPYGFTKRLKPGGEDWDRVSHVPSISIF